MSDRIVVMREGRIEQAGSPAAIYERPATRFAASFIGESNILEGRIEDGSTPDSVREEGGAASQTPAGRCLFAPPTADALPDDIRLTREPPAGFTLSGLIADQQYTGSLLRTTVRLSGGLTLKANRHGRLRNQLETGETVYVSWNPAHAALIGGYKDAEPAPFPAACGEAEEVQ